jgi:hypothetical protein
MDIKKQAEELLKDLQKIKSGDLKKKMILEKKMIKITNLSDELILSQELKNANILINSNKDIISVYSFLMKYPEFNDKVKGFFED